MLPDRFGILLFRGKGFISAAIRFQTWGDYAHAALLVPGGNIIEAMQFAGVRIRELTDEDMAGADLYDVPCCSPKQWIDAADFAHDQIGKKYDYLGVMRFLDRRPGLDRDSWFCSELVFAALWNQGVQLLHKPAWKVNPTNLAESPETSIVRATVPRSGPMMPLEYRRR